MEYISFKFKSFFLKQLLNIPIVLWYKKNSNYVTKTFVVKNTIARYYITD